VLNLILSLSPSRPPSSITTHRVILHQLGIPVVGFIFLPKKTHDTLFSKNPSFDMAFLLCEVYYIYIYIYIYPYLNITPFFTSRWCDLVDLYLVGVNGAQSGIKKSLLSRGNVVLLLST
jgi:hypothetical protein